MNELIFLVDRAFYVYNLVLLARVLMSWLPGVDSRNPIVQLLVRLTDPVLEPLRRVIPPVAMIDISPIVALVLLEVVRRLVLGTLIAAVSGL
ncbi:MAG: YggT family protein [Armatimonadota bacterium]|nr:YggT family protein [Armatimonadota bacterium]MDR5696951.1 YggT family protein [Armatimonadota bacterium]